MVPIRMGPSRTHPIPPRQETQDMTQPDRRSGYQEVLLSSHKLVLMFGERAWSPPTDVYEIENEIIIKMEIPGIETEEININLNDDKLDIKGTRVDQETRPKRVFRQMEINYGQFQRNILIHGPYDAQNIKATYKNGFLEIVMPKVKKSKPARKEVEITFEK